MTKLFLFFIIVFSTFSSLTYADFHYVKNGPVSASLYYYQYSNSALHIDYTGYLQVCDEYYLGNEVNMIIVVKDRYGKNVSLKKKMTSLCKNPIDPSSLTKTTYSITPKNDYKLWERIFIDGENTTLVLAFEFEGKWDSNYNKNYLLTFE